MDPSAPPDPALPNPERAYSDRADSAEQPQQTLLAELRSTALLFGLAIAVTVGAVLVGRVIVLAFS